MIFKILIFHYSTVMRKGNKKPPVDHYRRSLSCVNSSVPLDRQHCPFAIAKYIIKAAL